MIVALVADLLPIFNAMYPSIAMQNIIPWPSMKKPISCIIAFPRFVFFKKAYNVGA